MNHPNVVKQECVNQTLFHLGAMADFRELSERDFIAHLDAITHACQRAKHQLTTRHIEDFAPAEDDEI